MLHQLPFRGVLGTLRTVSADEGVHALWKGLGPGLQHQVLYGGLRIGLYDPVKALFPVKPAGETSFFSKVAAGIVTASFAIAVASPTDLVKVRMQAEAKLPPGLPKRYPSALGAYAIIIREEGVAALWTGLGPNVARNVAVSTAALASYDQIKEVLLKLMEDNGACHLAGSHQHPFRTLAIPAGLFSDNVTCHLASSLVAGFMSTVCGSPFDVIKSRMMGAAPGTYSGMMDAFLQTLRREGPLALYNGFAMNYARLGSWNVVMFLTLEQELAMHSKIVAILLAASLLELARAATCSNFAAIPPTISLAITEAVNNALLPKKGNTKTKSTGKDYIKITTPEVCYDGNWFGFHLIYGDCVGGKTYSGSTGTMRTLYGSFNVTGVWPQIKLEASIDWKPVIGSDKGIGVTLTVTNLKMAMLGSLTYRYQPPSTTLDEAIPASLCLTAASVNSTTVTFDSVSGQFTVDGGNAGSLPPKVIHKVESTLAAKGPEVTKNVNAKMAAKVGKCFKPGSG
eukprot:scaffold3.g6288.t1